MCVCFKLNADVMSCDVCLFHFLKSAFEMKAKRCV